MKKNSETAIRRKYQGIYFNRQKGAETPIFKVLGLR